MRFFWWYGKTWDTYDKYEGRRRVRVKFYSQNQNIPSLPFASKLDGVIQFMVDQSGLTEQQLDKLFWDNAWKQANKFLCTVL